ncbi:MAG TPA: glutathione S-transferase family protein [Burkholderiaceae bacterium]|nr:glutathione S-transferase family protein [Burkholderiaceae bacterium]
MKLYCHPASTTSRVVMQYAAKELPQLQYQIVDLFTGEHQQPAYRALNPSCLVPMLEDGDFRLTECSAILKYLADKTGSAAYPQELRARARVNEVMDWFNTNLYRDLAYNLVYPQTFPTHKRRSDEAQSATLEWGQRNSRNWMKVLDQHLIGNNRSHLCGDAITIADYLGAEMVYIAELIGSDLAPYPNVSRWLSAMKREPDWRKVHEAIDGFAASLKGRQFVTL